MTSHRSHRFHSPLHLGTLLGSSLVSNDMSGVPPQPAPQTPIWEWISPHHLEQLVLVCYRKTLIHLQAWGWPMGWTQYAVIHKNGQACGHTTLHQVYTAQSQHTGWASTKVFSSASSSSLVTLLYTTTDTAQSQLTGWASMKLFSSSLVTLSTFSIAERTLDQVKGRPPVWGARPSHMENISVQQASVWWGLLFSMAERQLSFMSRLRPMAFQFGDTLGTTIFCSSIKDGFLLSRRASPVEEEKPVAIQD